MSPHCGAHLTIADCAQVASHETSQHSGSTEQTFAQHSASSHEGVACGMSHAPVPAPPQAVHAATAAAAQSASHRSVQQLGSVAQTEAQQSAFAQPTAFSGCTS
jgi:hypothetical protein